MTPRVGRATVTVAGQNPREGVAFVRIGEGPPTRVRWRVHPVRWRCDAHPDTQDCTHTRAVTRHLAGVAMTEETPQ